MKLLISLVFCVLFLIHCNGYKILAVFPMPVGSHYILNARLVNELVNRGHEVTHVTPYPQKNAPRNLKEIATSPEALKEHKKILFDLDQEDTIILSRFTCDVGYTMSEHVLQHEEIQKLLHSEEKYDLVMMPLFTHEALLGIAHHFKAPLVLVTTMPLFSWVNFMLGIPSSPAYVPNLLGRYSGRMNFWQRVVNSYDDLYTILYHQWVTLPKHRELVKTYIPGQPDLYDFLNNGSIILINSHLSIYDAVPQIPNAINIGGFHIEEPKKLPADLQKFLDEAVDGVVVFSMGSNLKSTDLSPQTRDGILKAFSKLKQKVLWKWEDDQMPGQPQNVKIMKWLPQSDVLSHPNVKAVINHGGLLSITEAVHYAIPVIGIPVFGDQKMNMAQATSKGYAIALPLKELSEETLSQALDQVLNDPKYKDNAQKRSQIMRDIL